MIENMIENIISKIAEHEERVFTIYKQHTRKGRSHKHTPVKRKDFGSSFTALLNTLQEFSSKKSAWQVSGIEDPERYGMSIIEEARRFHDMGVSSELFLYFFKNMVQALEECVVDLEFSDKEIKNSLTAIRRITDTLEIAIIDEWKRLDNPETKKEFESAYRRLQQEKDTYENIYKGTKNLILITNRQGYIVEANPPAELFFGPEKVHGRTCWDLTGISCNSIPEIFEAFPPGKTHEIKISNGDNDKIFNLNILPCDSQNESLCGIIMLFNDITHVVDSRRAFERYMTERILAQENTEKRRSAIFQSVGEGILLVDQEFEIINANQQAAEIYGLPLQNLIGSDIRFLTDEPGSRRLMRFFEELVEGQRLSAEITGIYVDGRTFPTRTTATRIDYDGKRFWTIIVHDNTEQKAMEERLLQEKKQIEEMNVTLKNVLNVIEKDRRDFENRLSARIRTSILPALERVDNEADASVRKSYLTLLGQQLVALTSGFDTELDAGLLKLSKTEIEVCRLVQAGCSSKEICEAMNLSFETIQTHRKNIRKKLNLRGRKVNLHAFLSNRIVDPGKGRDKKD